MCCTDRWKKDSKEFYPTKAPTCVFGIQKALLETEFTFMFKISYLFSLEEFRQIIDIFVLLFISGKLGWQP